MTNNTIELHILDMSKFKSNSDSKYDIEKESSMFLISKYTGLGELKTNEYGKPYKENGIYFNISHSHNYCIIGVANFDLGVDIEFVKPRTKGLEKMVLSEEELKYNVDLRTFYKMWTNKESLVKCMGTGIISKIQDIPALPFFGKKEYKGELYYSQSISYEEYEISVTYQNSENINIKLMQEN